MKIRPIAMFYFKPGFVLRRACPLAVFHYNLALYESGASLIPNFRNGYVGVVREAVGRFANMCDVFTRTWAEYDDPREFLREMKRCGYVEAIAELVLEGENCWAFKDGVEKWETEI